MGFKNLSNGKSDGFTIFYLKDGKLKTVLLTKDQAESLDLSLKLAFGDNGATIVDTEKEAMLKLIEGD